MIDRHARLLGFSASPRAAHAGEPIRIKDHVRPKVARLRVFSPKRLSVDDHTCADAGTERHHHQIVAAAASAVFPFPEDGRVGVVLDVDRQIQLLARPLCEVDGPEPFVLTDHLADDTVDPHVHQRRKGKAHTGALLIPHRPEHLGRPVECLLSPPIAVSGDRLALRHLSVLDEPDLDVRPAHVDCQNAHVVSSMLCSYRILDRR